MSGQCRAWLLGLGLVGFALAVGSLLLAGQVTQVELVEHVFRIDPETRVLIESESSSDRALAYWRVYEPFDELLLPLSGVAVVALVLVCVGLRRLDRQLAIGLVRIAAPLLVAALLGVVAGALTHRTFEYTLLTIHELLTREQVHFTGDGLCQSYMEPCSELAMTETDRALMLLGLSLVVLSLIPAARAAWRAGVSGRRLAVGWSVAAWICLGVGALGLLGTRAHRVDRESTLAACEAGQLFPWRERMNARIFAHGIGALALPEPERCDASVWIEHVERLRIVEEFQIVADGRVVAPWRSGVDVYESLESNVEIHRDFDGRFDSSAPAVLLYVDERAPLASLAEFAATVGRLGIEQIVLGGRAFEADELVSVGAFRRPIYCPVGRLTNPSTISANRYKPRYVPP